MFGWDKAMQPGVQNSLAAKGTAVQTLIARGAYKCPTSLGCGRRRGTPASNLLGVVTLGVMALPDVELLLHGVDNSHDCLLAGLLAC